MIKDVGIDSNTAVRLSSQEGGTGECIVSKYCLNSKRIKACIERPPQSKMYYTTVILGA